jgi:hypothetical protein
MWLSGLVGIVAFRDRHLGGTGRAKFPQACGAAGAAAGSAAAGAGASVGAVGAAAALCDHYLSRVVPWTQQSTHRTRSEVERGRASLSLRRHGRKRWNAP